MVCDSKRNPLLIIHSFMQVERPTLGGFDSLYAPIFLFYKLPYFPDSGHPESTAQNNHLGLARIDVRNQFRRIRVAGAVPLNIGIDLVSSDRPPGQQRKERDRARIPKNGISLIGQRLDGIDDLVHHIQKAALVPQQVIESIINVADDALLFPEGGPDRLIDKLRKESGDHW